MKLPILAAAAVLLASVGAASAQWGPPSSPSWSAPRHGYDRGYDRRPEGWRGPRYERRYGPPHRCWIEDGPWGPRRVCGRPRRW
jgi:hypothetical protein